jgi:DNA phosphorothioation-dependent restriction protein DptF
VSKIAEFDPANKRSKVVDKFILSHSLKLPDARFEQFLADLSIKGLRKGQQSETYLRLFYILRNAEFSNNYHADFKADFHEQLIDKYSSIWHLHTAYEGLQEQRSAIKNFYKEIAIAAIHKYNNRNAPNLNKGEFFICERNGYQLAAHIDLKVDIKMIEGLFEEHVSHFHMFFKIGDESLGMPANINLLHLMQRIVDGYRPNKHDKNTVVILDEIVDSITEVANSSDTLYILKNDQRIKITSDGEDLEVSGL